MAEPLVQRVIIDAGAAQRQLADLERDLHRLDQPINVPINLGTESLRRDIAQADNQFGQLNSEVRETQTELKQLDRVADTTGDAVLRVGTRGTSAFTNLRGSIIGVGAAIAAIQGAKILGNFAFDAIQSASNLEESLSKTNVVFESLSGGIQDFAKTAPRALGLSTAAALEATSTFGNLFLALGLTRQVAADLSPDIVQLAADLASFNNIAVDEAVEKLRSGLVGEVEPLRTLGVNLNAAVVEAKALALGFVDANGAVTEAGKVQARYALILEQTTTAQGDYARTADGIANTQRTLSAEFENAKTTLGQALLPAYKQLLDILPGLIDGVEALAPTFAAVGVSLTSAAEGGTPFLALLLDIVRVLPGAVNALTAFFSPTGTDFLNDSALQTNQIMSTMIRQIREGVDPAKALTNSLAELARVIDRPEDLAKYGEQLARVAGVEPGRLDDITRLLITQGEAAGLDTTQVLQLVSALGELNNIPPPPPRPGSRGGDQRTEANRNREISATALELAAAKSRAAREEAAAARLAQAAIASEAQALEILGAAADEQGVSIRNLLTDTAALPPLQQAAASALSNSTLKYLEQVDAINALGRQFEALPGAMDAAQAALKNSEGEIINDFSDFFANLQEELGKREAFESNLAILRALGLDDLASVFDEAGLEAAKALADAVANPAEARNAEAALKGTATDQAAAYIDTFKEAIAGIPVTQGLIDNIIQAAAEADTPEVQQALLALAESLGLQIPVTFDTTNLGGFAVPENILRLITPPPSDRGDAGRGGDTNVTINNPTTNDLITDAQRAGGIINSVISGQRGAQ